MAKVKVAFEFDLEKISPDFDRSDIEAAAKEVVATMLLKPTRQRANARNIEARQGDLPYSERQRIMAEALRISMLTLAAESNMTVEPLEAGAEINTLLPLERAA